MEDRLLQNQEKSSGKNCCLLALLSLVAIAGVGIGVFSVVHSSSLQGDINELRSQLKALQNMTPASNATVGKLMAEVQAAEASITNLQNGVLSINQFLGDDSVVTSLQCLDDTTKLAYASNGMAVARCPANCDASVSAGHLWGTQIYSASSSICLAAVHDGELQLPTGGIVRVVEQPGQIHYTGTTQHGVTSSDKDSSKSSFSIETTLLQNISKISSDLASESNRLDSVSKRTIKVVCNPVSSNRGQWIDPSVCHADQLQQVDSRCPPGQVLSQFQLANMGTIDPSLYTKFQYNFLCCNIQWQ